MRSKQQALAGSFLAVAMSLATAGYAADCYSLNFDGRGANNSFISGVTTTPYCTKKADYLNFQYPGIAQFATQTGGAANTWVKVSSNTIVLAATRYLNLPTPTPGSVTINVNSFTACPSSGTVAGGCATSSSFIAYGIVNGKYFSGTYTGFVSAIKNK